MYPRNNQECDADKEDEFGLKRAYVENILDPQVVYKVIERGSIGKLRKQHQREDPLIGTMTRAFSKYY